MKNSFLSLVTIVALSSLSFAGGDIAPIESEIEPIPTEVSIDESAFYLGLGASTMGLYNDLSDEEFTSTGMMVQVGYQYNRYLALEARYTANVADVEYDHGTSKNANIADYPADFTNMGIYIKPIYPIGAFSLYALLGYGEVTLTNVPLGSMSADRGEDGFQWGIGASYQITDSLDIFADYTTVYDDQGFNYRGTNADVNGDLVTIGLSYRF